jgi:hypothetical protein
MELGSPVSDVCYIGYPDVIPDHRLQWILFAHDLTMTLATAALAMPSPVPFRSSQHSDRLNPLVKLLGGIPVEALQLPSITQSHWPSGSTGCFLPSKAAVRIRGCDPHFQLNQVLPLEMSRYKRICSCSII